jgi:hypothetical protein
MHQRQWVQEFASVSEVTLLSREADQALKDGDHKRCLDIIAQLYDLLDEENVAD